jgi:hypothetical protein
MHELAPVVYFVYKAFFLTFCNKVVLSVPA